MKKQKIVIGLNTLILTIFGFLATKGSNRFAHPMNGIFIGRSGIILGSMSNLTAGFDTVPGPMKALVRLTTAGGTVIATMFTGVQISSKKVYR